MIVQSDKYLKSGTELGVNAKNNLVNPPNEPAHLHLNLDPIHTYTVPPVIHTVAVELHFQMSSSWTKR